ncbi:hypothetical protein [Pseudomonas sp. UFMG81]|uniref:hypothetical protein n=1 Tax=Pseudomonas sp. UFMG81 TaxID=2745936 RepID=UPI00188EDAF5|nr:hypothetical protein [Pseudomonas sp. UFMG81]
MSKTFLPLALGTALLAGCASPQHTVSLDKPRLIGNWAMLPLGNGIANVAEYQADGKVRLHPFNCVESTGDEVEVSDYRVAADGKSIHVSSPQRTFDLQVLAYSGNLMVLGMQVDQGQLKFMYKKVDTIAPLCNLYPDAKAEAARRTEYQTQDFVPAPTIPAHAGMERYIGNWVSMKQGQRQVQIMKGADGQPYLSLPDSENWRYLFNDVRWEGDVLHYQGFAYSPKPSLYRHPYHKSNMPMTLAPAADGKLLSTFEISGKRYEYILQRAD